MNPYQADPNQVTGAIALRVLRCQGMPLADHETNEELAERIRREFPGSRATRDTVANVRSRVRKWLWQERRLRWARGQQAPCSVVSVADIRHARKVREYGVEL